MSVTNRGFVLVTVATFIDSAVYSMHNACIPYCAFYLYIQLIGHNMKIIKMYVRDMLAKISRIALLSSLVCSYRLRNMCMRGMCSTLLLLSVYYYFILI